MKVKIFDESHEADLEERVNEFLSEHTDIIDIKFQVSITMFSEEQLNHALETKQKKIVQEWGLGYLKSIYNGEYILNLETLQKSNIEIKETEFAIQKLVTDDDKYLLFIQITDILDESFGDEDLAIMSEEIQKAVRKSNNIAGVVILPSNMEISLITAKLDTLSYAKTLKFSEQDLDFIKSLNLKPDENGVIDYRKPIIETLGNYYKDNITSCVDKSESPYINLSFSPNKTSSVLDKYFD